MSLAIWAVVGACAIAVYTDLSTRRIPNALTLALAGIALALHIGEGWRSLLVTVTILLTITAFGLIAFSFGWLGGGDVKLAAAAGATLGYPDVIPFLLYMSIGGGVLALLVALSQRRVFSVVANVGVVLRPLLYKGTVAIAPAKTTALPYAVAIAIGAVAVALSHSIAPFLRLPI